MTEEGGKPWSVDSEGPVLPGGVSRMKAGRQIRTWL